MKRLKNVGVRAKNLDAEEKVTGEAKFCLDLKKSDMLWGKIKRSTRPHAEILNIDYSKALSLSGVRAIITSTDIPDTRYGYGLYDQPILARKKVRFIGDPLAAVAADNERIAEEACDRIEVTYGDLTPLFDPEVAAEPNPPAIIHENLSNYERIPLGESQYDFQRPNIYSRFSIISGDLDQGLDGSDYTIKNRFTNAMIPHSPIERHNHIGQMDRWGNVTVWSANQSPYGLKTQISEALKVPPSKVRIIVPKHVGGGFGGKLDMKAEAICALLSKRAKGRPVKICFTLDESLFCAGIQHAFIVDLKTGVSRNGKLLALHAKILIDGGSYSGHGYILSRKVCYALCSTYKIPNIKIDAEVTYTNHPPGAPYRGFGHTQISWALESHMDCIAKELKWDSTEFRLDNVLEDGDISPAGELVQGINIKQCVQKVKEGIGWDESFTESEGFLRKGRGIAIGNKNCVAPTASSAIVKVKSDGELEILNSGVDIGQGLHTVLAQIAAEVFQTSLNKIKIVPADTNITPFDMMTHSSRQTFCSGNAVLLAAENARKQVISLAAKRLETDCENLFVRDGIVYVEDSEDKSIAFRDLFQHDLRFGGPYLADEGEILGKATFKVVAEKTDPRTGRCNPSGTKRIHSFIVHNAQAVEVAVDIQTGHVYLLRWSTSVDAGKAINILGVEGQMDGALSMALGGALFEELIFSDGKVENANFVDFKIPTALDIPNLSSLSTFIVESDQHDGPFGAKGIGEVVMGGLAPAIANAIHDAIGIRLNHIPMTPERVFKALREYSEAQNNLQGK